MLKQPIIAGAACAVASFGLSFAHPFGDPRAAHADPAALMMGAQASPEIRVTLERKCATCHSESSDWPFYAHLAPMSWLLEHDVVTARAHWNQSRWPEYSADQKADLLARIAAEAHSGEMPPSRYTMIHPDAKLTPDDQQQIYTWAKAERKRILQQQATADTNR